MDRTAVMQGPVAAGMKDFVRPAGVDLPSLAESVRSVEERISRQHAEYEALTRAYERARDAESDAAARASALAVDLAASRAACTAGSKSAIKTAIMAITTRSSINVNAPPT